MVRNRKEHRTASTSEKAPDYLGGVTPSMMGARTEGGEGTVKSMKSDLKAKHDAIMDVVSALTAEKRSSLMSVGEVLDNSIADEEERGHRSAWELECPEQVEKL